MKRYLATFILIGLLTHSASSQEQAVFGNGFYGSLGHIGIDEDKARAEGVGDSAVTLEGGYYGVYQGLLTIKTGLYFPIIDDKASFTQAVEDNTGDRSTESSDISAWGILIEGGLRFPVNETLSLGSGLGYRSLSADRDIALCRDCRTDLDLKGGAYLRPYLNIDAYYFHVEISYEEYFTGDYTGGASATFIYNI